MSFNHILRRTILLRIIIKLIIIACLNLSWGSEYLSDKEFVSLAYSFPGAENVGALHSVYKYPWCQNNTLYKYGSVVYIGGLTCLTAAHCLHDEASFFDYVDLYEYFRIGDKVSFEINGFHTYFDIKHAVIHPGYDGTPLHDIAVLCLDRAPEGLLGLDADYSLGTHDIGGNNQDVLTYVGYGRGGNDIDCFEWVDDKRRACQSRLFKVQGTAILSLPYLADINAMGNEKYTLTQRQAFGYESIARPAMSGGATLLNNAFVGVNMGCSYTLLSWDKSGLFHCWYYIGSFTNLFITAILPIINLPRLHTKYPCVGAISASVVLGTHEEWIKECKSVFDNYNFVDSRV